MSQAVELVEDEKRFVRQLQAPGYHEVRPWKEHRSGTERRRFKCDDELCAFITVVEGDAQSHFKRVHQKLPAKQQPSKIIVTDASGRPKTEV